MRPSRQARLHGRHRLAVAQAPLIQYDSVLSRKPHSLRKELQESRRVCIEGRRAGIGHDQVRRLPRNRASRSYGNAHDLGRTAEKAASGCCRRRASRSNAKAEELRFVDDRGHRVGGFGIDVFRELPGGRYLSIPRGGLASLIHGRIDGRCETIFGDSITSIRQTADAVEVEFERTPSRRFDLVIGADGLHSTVRALVFGNQNLFERYLGYVVAAFEVEGYRPRDEDVYVSYAVPGKQVARFALRGDRTLFLLVFTAEHPPVLEPHDMQGHKALPRGEFDGAGWECRRILAALDPMSTSIASARSVCNVGRKGALRWWATQHLRPRSLPVRARPLP